MTRPIGDSPAETANYEKVDTIRLARLVGTCLVDWPLSRMQASDVEEYTSIGGMDDCCRRLWMHY